MSLLREIQAAAVDSSEHLPDLLRKCKLLGARLGSADFKAWVEHELNGYPDGSPVPAYRVLNVISYGNFVGPGGSALNNGPIPPLCIPEKHRESVSVVQTRDPVSAIADLVRDPGRSELMAPWAPDFTAFYGDKIYQGMNCIYAWRSISRSSMVAILDAVRTRILSFAIEIESESPDAGEAPLGTSPVRPEHVSQVFNTNIWGSVGNVAAGSHTFSQESDLKVIQGDLDSLRKYLSDLQIPPNELATLEGAIADDQKRMGPHRSIGSSVGSWIGRMIQKAAEGTVKMGASVAGTLLTKAIAKYYGLDH